jgi:hypothetical protein
MTKLEDRVIDTDSGLLYASAAAQPAGVTCAQRSPVKNPAIIPWRSKDINAFFSGSEYANSFEN